MGYKWPTMRKITLVLQETKSPFQMCRVYFQKTIHARRWLRLKKEGRSTKRGDSRGDPWPPLPACRSSYGTCNRYNLKLSIVPERLLLSVATAASTWTSIPYHRRDVKRGASYNITYIHELSAFRRADKGRFRTCLRKGEKRRRSRQKAARPRLLF